MKHHPFFMTSKHKNIFKMHLSFLVGHNPLVYLDGVIVSKKVSTELFPKITQITTRKLQKYQRAEDTKLALMASNMKNSNCSRDSNQYNLCSRVKLEYDPYFCFLHTTL